MSSQVTSIKTNYADSVPAAIAAPRRAWRSLIWTVPVTVLWIVLTYSLPGISASGVPATTVRLITYVLIGVGLWLGLEGTEL